MKLTKLERRTLINQFEILKRLSDSEPSYPPSTLDHYIKALESGYAYHYDQIIGFENSDELSEEASKEVIDILDMYRSITFGYKEIESDTDIDKEKIKFLGFDGNKETKLMLYAQYYIKDLGNYRELRDENERIDLDSHMPMLGDYRDMLQRYKTYPPATNLNEMQIRELLEL